MIVDRLDRWARHLQGPVWKKAFEHLATLGPDAPEETIELMGKDLTARVMSYSTKTAGEARIEAHREHIDIQMSLVNDERIDWWPLEGLVPSTEYDPAKDVTFFKDPGHAPASVMNRVGHFTVLFPEDAHMPQLHTGAPHVVKKVVIKVRLSALK